MRYAIVRETPGRMRLRLAAGFLQDEEARGIEKALVSLDGVLSAQVHVANGSLLLLFAPDARDAVLACVAGFDVLHLPRDTPAQEDTDLALRLEDERFATRAGGLAAWTLLRRVVLPAPLRAVLTVLRTSRFVAEGMRHLLSCQLTVEVLDATALVASVLRGSYGEADTIMFLLQLSDLMQEHLSNRTRLALEQGLVARAATLWKVTEDGDVLVATDDVSCDDLLRFRTGMVLAVDGVVVSGEAEVNEASMTGEATLVHKGPGVSVFSGTALEDGELVVRVTAAPGEARIDAIAQMVERSSELKAASQGRAEHLADALVPVAFASFIAILAVTRNVDPLRSDAPQVLARLRELGIRQLVMLTGDSVHAARAVARRSPSRRQTRGRCLGGRTTRRSLPDLRSGRYRPSMSCQRRASCSRSGVSGRLSGETAPTARRTAERERADICPSWVARRLSAKRSRSCARHSAASSRCSFSASRACCRASWPSSRASANSLRASSPRSCASMTNRSMWSLRLRLMADAALETEASDEAVMAVSAAIAAMRTREKNSVARGLAAATMRVVGS